MSYVMDAKCTVCGHVFPAGPETTVCPDCGGILDIEYDYDAIRSALTKETLAGRTDRTMWRYMEFLPVDGIGSRPRLRVGGSPLYRADRLAKTLGVKTLYIKDDGQNPTASLKDRASAMAVVKAEEAGKEIIACSSTGNAASSLAGNAAGLLSRFGQLKHCNNYEIYRRILRGEKIQRQLKSIIRQSNRRELLTWSTFLEQRARWKSSRSKVQAAPT